ncbi:MAG: type III-A CRISPR-associated RAMP protein Csm5 [Armatimonadota bacterium]|nr:type III-A CRISPR-associated RAMP protein Csm5 [Armatimonadota bacterium]MDR7610118.1 type III-A CRISPR-associated RAMP protein Csm5 [Armatimonadota bacterium]
MTRQLVSTTTYTLRCLSPVHVGTEERLGGHDVLVLQRILYRVDAARLLTELEQAREARDRYLSGGLSQIVQWLQQGGRLKRLSVYSCRVPRDPRPREDLRPFLADPLGRPYVPGTELKGAVRTAVLWHRISQQPDSRDSLARRVGRTRNRRGEEEDQRDRRSAGEWLEDTLLGGDPHEDAFRAIRFGDSTPVPSAHLRVYPILVTALQRDGLAAMQSPGSRSQPGRYAQDPASAVASFCECLHETDSQVRVELDTYLLENHQRWRRDSFLPDRWTEACNAFSRWVADRERQWWVRAANSAPHAMQRLAQSVASFYTDLVGRVGNLGPGQVVLNLGWGGGWRTKTVSELFGDQVVQEMVRRYRLDRGSGSRPFPKTRKVAWVSQDRFLPMGWVVLSP